MSFVKVNLVLKTDRQTDQPTDRPKYRSDLPSLKNSMSSQYLYQVVSNEFAHTAAH